MNFELNFNGLIKHTKTDFFIVSQNGKEIPCHKFVLAERSPVFDAMFEMKDSIEVSNGQIKIIDVSDEALEVMVQFIYSQILPSVEVDLYQDLLILSNKYDLKVLAKTVLPKFINMIDSDNCIDAYAFGIVHEYKKVKTAAFSIIVFKWDLLLKEKSILKTFSKSHPKEHKSLAKKIAKFDYDGCRMDEDNSDDDDEVSIGKKNVQFTK